MNNKYLVIIKQIETARSNNNRNWMNILRLAYEYAPIKANKVIKEINKSDKKISVLVSKLSKLNK